MQNVVSSTSITLITMREIYSFGHEVDSALLNYSSIFSMHFLWVYTIFHVNLRIFNGKSLNIEIFVGVALRGSVLLSFMFALLTDSNFSKR